MTFTFTNLKNLYYGCHFIGWADGIMPTAYDAGVLFVADSNHNIIAQVESVYDEERDICIGFKPNELNIEMLGHHTIDLMEWLDGGCTIREF